MRFLSLIFQFLLTLFFSCISRISICTQFRIPNHFSGFVLGFFTLPCSCIFLLFYFDLHMPKIVSSSSWFHSFIVQPIIYGITATSSELCSSLFCNIHNLSKRGGKNSFCCPIVPYLWFYLCYNCCFEFSLFCFLVYYRNEVVIKDKILKL